ncbi:hypothetical protein CBM2623_A120053 [Cupriavidus taiwanensis]|nr:hypothetical protein CBM2623_A120053 [Cupriavidus taiwanensis]
MHWRRAGSCRSVRSSVTTDRLFAPLSRLRERGRGRGRELAVPTRVPSWPRRPSPHPSPASGRGSPPLVIQSKAFFKRYAVPRTEKNCERPTQRSAWRHHVDDPFPPRPELHSV